MSPRAIQMLQWLRECDCKFKGNDFNRGYTLGFLNAIKFKEVEPWERYYLDVIANRVLAGLPS